MPSKKKNKNNLKEGWVVELKEAEREVKTANQATPEQCLICPRRMQASNLEEEQNCC
jgi:hypothetical protein